MSVSNFIIKGTIYPFDVMVSLGQEDAALNEALKKQGVDITDENIGTHSSTLRGRCVMFGSGQVLIRLFEHPETCEDYGHLQHEIFHAVYFIMDRIGMKLSYKSDEAFAYFTGYLTEKIYEQL